jgi:hypothetical protein
VASLAELENLLKEASRLLDRAAAEIRDLGLEPEKNVRRVAEAIVLASEIRAEIYNRRPDLTPEYFKKK